MLKKTHKTLFYILILLLPTQLTKHFWPSFAFISGIRIDYLAPTIYLTDILLFATITTWFLSTIKSIKKNEKRIVFLGGDRPSILLFFLLLSAFIVLNILSAASPWIALFKWLKIGEMALLALYIIKTKPSLRITYYLLLIASLVSIVLAWLQYIKGGSIGGILYWIGERTFTLGTPGIARQSFFGREYLRPYATFPHPNVLAGFLTATLPLILFPQNTTKSDARTSKFVVFLLTIIVTIWLGTIFITGSQVAFIISLGILFLFLPVQYKKPALLLIFAVCILLFSTIHYPPSTILSSKSFTRRWSLGIAAIQMFLSSPITGIGLNNFVIRLPEFYRLKEPAFFLQPAHNIYLLVLVEGGIVGLILFTVVIYKLFRRWKLEGGSWIPKIENRKLKNSILYPQSSNSTICFLPSTLALLLLGFFDHYLFTLQQGLLLFVIILSFAFLTTKKP